ncbi:OmpP1/FadL family transporter [Bizionia sediminis]|uniref:OmpP1/FadL family transporter n=1 Tax=Bizionia sediminis TaxID=1737064 RepID=A0ABW5KPA8_9FLAO
MKKILLFALASTLLHQVQAQGISDALRYSEDNIQGSARYRGLSGAFGALGGDISAISINPAGSAVFNDGMISFSLAHMKTKNETTYFEGSANTSDTNFDINQTGAAFVFQNNNPNSAWKKFTLAASYDKINDYENDWFAYGTNPNTSIADYFLNYANGLRLDEISAFPGESFSEAYREIGSFYSYGHQQAFLGYESYILNPLTADDANTVYTSAIAPGRFYQEYTYASRGFNGKFTFNVGAQVGEKLFLGINLNSHVINYERSTFLYEANNNVGSVVNTVRFQNNLFTNGSGFSFQLGAIYRVTPSLRAGFSYNSPTWITLEEESSQSISTLRQENGGNVNQIVNPFITNIFPTYKLRSPGKYTGSVAYVFGNKGLISFDYSIRDFSNTKLKPGSDPFFSRENKRIENLLSTAATYKIGGEYKLQRFSFRAGYRFEESPYKNNKVVGDLSGYSAGIGYNFGNYTKLDITYDQTNQTNKNQLYTVGLTDSASVDSKVGIITATLSFSL